ncbi:hypothetical protein ElyMa_005542500 [Elysia marginata]|uniref:Uncharacterized protein n=1 Tax=Elysia marginata TaxID=1093978 RepID=A0AAV4EYU2_9GAST|nr:hypothetical protein ElyMa_005542500 [Elysia marginata]
MDFDSSSKFISSLAKFLQSLCNGYVEFNNGVEVIGHIYINVDTGKKIDYILNEKVCKTEENSVTFISNSFHAQPAEKPKPVKPPKPNNSETENAVSLQLQEEEIIIMDDAESESVSTRPVQQHQKNRPLKRSHNQGFSSGHRSKFGKTDQSAGHSVHNSQFPLDSLHSEDSSSNSKHFSRNSSMTPATGTDMSHEPKVFPQSFGDSSNSHTEERDIKPCLDEDLNLVNVKQEYDVSGQGGEEYTERYEESQGTGDDYPDMQYEYYGDGSEGGPDYSHMSAGSQGDYYQEGAGMSGDGVASDSTGKFLHL